jgi:hypothetical protein
LVFYFHENHKGGENVKKQVKLIMFALILALVLCGGVSAADTSDTGNTVQNVQTPNHQQDSNQSSYTQNNISSALPDPYNPRTGQSYTTIQAAIDDPLTLNYDTILVEAGNYPENVLVNKRLNITATGAATVTSFSINSLGNGSIIQGFNINNSAGIGLIMMGCSNCQILKNVITGRLMAIQMVGGNNNIISENTLNGLPNAAGYSETIYLANSIGNILTKNIITATATGTGTTYGVMLNTGGDSNTISENTITAVNTGTGSVNGIIGIMVNGISNIISKNTITTDGTGTYITGINIGSEGCVNNIIGNNIKAKYGIYSYNANNQANFNRILATDYAICLRTNTDTFNACYNWYGSNSDPSSKIYSDIGNVNYNPWLIMTVTAFPTTIYPSRTSTVTADFTQDSNGGGHDPSLGHFPDGVGVLISSTGGSVGSDSITAYTRDGVATATFRADRGPGTGTAAGSLDKQEPLSVNINILQAPTVNSAYSTNTIGMQKTGAPIIVLFLAALLMFAGFVIPRRI